MELYEHQKKAVEQLRNGSVLVGGVGSGKSRTALAYYFCRECGGMIDGTSHGFDKDYIPMSCPKDLYIITTARKRDTMEWEGELSYFLLTTHQDNSFYKTKVVVDSWNNIKKYTDVKNSFFIFDEQRVVGSGAWVRAFLKITKSNRWILLSATPGDTWSDYIPVFIANGFYKNKSEFTRRHVRYKPYLKYPVVDRYLDCGTLLRYRRDIQVTMPFVRPTLPHHEHILVPYDSELTKIVMRTRQNPWTGEPIVDAGSLCYILRKIANSDEERIRSCSEICSLREKAIIFYNFDYELELLRKLPDQLNNGDKTWKIAEWNGHKHEPIPTGDRWIYLVQYTAGAEGWNCITTDTTIFYSQSYSYKMMVQAAGRTDRLNTPYKDLYFYHLRSYAPIDLAIYRALRQKKNFNEKSFVT